MTTTSAAGGDLRQREAALTGALGALPSLVVAYSGGVDSAYLAWAATRAIGARALCVTADSPSYPERHRLMALSIARAATGRRKILVARGAYHGSAPWCTPRPAGTTAEDRAHLIPFVYNDLASVEAAADQAFGQFEASGLGFANAHAEANQIVLEAPVAIERERNRGRQQVLFGRRKSYGVDQALPSHLGAQL